eukprot:TRINITY_DN6870_c0_g1_i1.p1 TRINITY_DN6870_c0_g1~~TRINITY_DN6870_c0_g1_i1.p1  ORF type:complete len:764 (+),score=227.05 TRINITY_DN6870_c0_g1_i1:276-2567(+)
MGLIGGLFIFGFGMVSGIALLLAGVFFGLATLTKKTNKKLKTSVFPSIKNSTFEQKRKKVKLPTPVTKLDVIGESGGDVAIIKQGPAMFKSRSWTLRYFVLRGDGSLTVYKSEKGLGPSDIVAVVKLHPKIDVRNQPQSGKAKLFKVVALRPDGLSVFAKTCPQGHLIKTKIRTRQCSMGFKDEGTCTSWHGAIKNACKAGSFEHANSDMMEVSENELSIDDDDETFDNAAQGSMASLKAANVTMQGLKPRLMLKRMLVLNGNVLTLATPKDSFDGTTIDDFPEDEDICSIVTMRPDTVITSPLDGTDATPTKKRASVVATVNPLSLTIEQVNKERIFTLHTPVPYNRKLEMETLHKHSCTLVFKNADVLADWIQHLRDAIAFLQAPPMEKVVPIMGEDVPRYAVPWLQPFLDKTFADICASKPFRNEINRRLVKIFGVVNRPDFLGEITVGEVLFGSEMLQIVGVNAVGTSKQGEITGEALISYAGGAGVEIGTELFVNWPREKAATVPIKATIKLVKLEGKLLIHVPPEIGARIVAFFPECPTLDFDVDVRVGSGGTRISKVGKIQKFLVSTMQKLLCEKTVYPARISLAIPFPGRKMELKTQTLSQQNRRSTSSTARQDAFPHETPDMIAKKYLLGRFLHEVFNEGKLEVLREICTPDVIINGSDPYFGHVEGFEGVAKLATTWRLAFPDLHIAVVDISTEGSNVIVKWKARGTHFGRFWDSPPTNEEVILSGLTITKIQFGLIAQQWMYYDPCTVYAFS